MKTPVLNLTLILLSSFFVKAQDTIYFKNQTVVPAKISEVGITEIKYHRFDNLDGPSYINSKTEIERIKYANGVIDTVAVTGLLPVLKSELQKNDVPATGLVLVRTELYYNHKIVGQLKARQLLRSGSLSEKQIRLIKDVKSLKLRGQGYNALGTGLFVTGFAVPVVVTFGALSASNNGSDRVIETIVTGAIAGVILRIAGHVVFKIGKNKAKAKRAEFLTQYAMYETI